MEKIKLASYLGAAAIIGILIGRFVIKPQTEIKTKEVIKYVEVFKEIKQEDKKVKTIIKEIVRPDGTKETITDITEDTMTDTITNRDTQLDVTKQQSVKTGSKVTIGVLALTDLRDFGRDKEYGITVAVPIFGSLYVQGLVTTDKKIGLGLAISF